MDFSFIAGHPYFVGVQFHPEYLTRPMKPSPPYLGLLLASCHKLDNYLQRGCRLSPRASFDFEDDSGDDEAYSSELSSIDESPTIK